MASLKRKLYAYVDESGQDTGGVFFVVGVVITESDRDALLKELEAIEEKSGKKNIKWHKSRHAFRKAYIESIYKSIGLKNKIFFKTFSNTKQFLEMTSYATAKALIYKAGGKEYSASIYVDGLNKQELAVFSRGLRELNVKKRKVKGVRREENNAFIRLADAVCGLVRDVYDRNGWAEGALKQLKKKDIIHAL
jgi:hypothetical protein